jgi:hypothetical protein
MPEPFTIAAIIGAKLFGGAVATGHAHAAAWILGGIAVGTTLYAIGCLLNELVEGNVLSKSEAKAYMKKAKSLPEHKRVEMKNDLQTMRDKWC